MLSDGTQRSILTPYQLSVKMKNNYFKLSKHNINVVTINNSILNDIRTTGAKLQQDIKSESNIKVS